jgi:hypothetical protein
MRSRWWHINGVNWIYLVSSILYEEVSSDTVSAKMDTMEHVALH